MDGLYVGFIREGAIWQFFVLFKILNPGQRREGISSSIRKKWRRVLLVTLEGGGGYKPKSYHMW